MGYYKNLHAKAIIKPEHREKVRMVVFEDTKWGDLFNHTFVTMWRSDLIPFGENKLFKYEIWDGATLTINCSIKNYEDELDIFFEFLKEISSEVTEYKTFDDSEYEETDNERVDRWYNYLTGEYEEIKKELENGD